VTTVSSDSPITATPAARRWGVGFAAIWLFFLADPLSQAWDTRDTAAGLVGGVATVVFGAYYMTIWLNLRRDRNEFAGPPGTARSVTYLVVLLALAGVMIATLGQAGTASLVYVAVAAVMIFPLRVAGLVVLGLGGLVVLLVRLNPGWSSPVSLLFSVFAAALAVFGIRQMMARNIDLVRADQKNAELAVENERTRFARDLHDILGHSLTAIAVKAGLARRLVERRAEGAAQEIADVERLGEKAVRPGGETGFAFFQFRPRRQGDDGEVAAGRKLLFADLRRRRQAMAEILPRWGIHPIVSEGGCWDRDPDGDRQGQRDPGGIEAAHRGRRIAAIPT
jgi:two-component system sensor histidine kinase DesK